jgi:hypothetical protein
MTDLVESEDELLDPPSGPAAAAPLSPWVSRLHRLRERLAPGGAEPDAEADPARRRRRILAGLLTVAVAAGAAATGAAVHSRDVAHAQTRTQDRMLMHLLGGTASLTFGDLSQDSLSNGFTLPSSLQIPLAAGFTVALRNDGAKPLEVTGIQISVPGVDVVGAAPHTTFAPGDSAALTTKVTVHCTAADLPRYPSGVSVTVRTPATATQPAGAPITVPLSFDPGHPASSSTDSAPSGDTYLGGRIDNIFSATTSFYELCGDVLAVAPHRVSATTVRGTPSVQDPVVRYTLHIDNSPGAEQMAVPLTKPPTVPGVSAQTDLVAPQQIGSEGLDVNVTDRVTDCQAFGDYLTARGGATRAVAELNAATPVGLVAADPRFQTTPTPLSSTSLPLFDALTPDTADMQATLLTQLAAVCPEL